MYLHLTLSLCVSVLGSCHALYWREFVPPLSNLSALRARLRPPLRSIRPLHRRHRAERKHEVFQGTLKVTCAPIWFDFEFSIIQMTKLFVETRTGTWAKRTYPSRLVSSWREPWTSVLSLISSKRTTNKVSRAYKITRNIPLRRFRTMPRRHRAERKHEVFQGTLKVPCAPIWFDLKFSIIKLTKLFVETRTGTWAKRTYPSRLVSSWREPWTSVLSLISSKRTTNKVSRAYKITRNIPLRRFRTLPRRHRAERKHEVFQGTLKVPCAPIWFDLKFSIIKLTKLFVETRTGIWAKRTYPSRFVSSWREPWTSVLSLISSKRTTNKVSRAYKITRNIPLRRFRTLPRRHRAERKYVVFQGTLKVPCAPIWYDLKFSIIKLTNSSSKLAQVPGQSELTHRA